MKYVEALIGPETINTVPPETLDAYRDHGRPAARLEEGLDKAERAFQRLESLGIDIDQVTQQLEDEGIEKFNKPFDLLMDALEHQRASILNRAVNPLQATLGDLQEGVRDDLQQLHQRRFVELLWGKDASLWKSDPQQQRTIQHALGWLDAPKAIKLELAQIDAFVSEVKQAGLRHVIHLGMGGSSLAALFLQRSFWPGAGGLALTVLDTTDPAAILATLRNIKLSETLVIVASKSGTTAEPRMLERYFFEQFKQQLGGEAGSHFVAITDPGTPLAQLSVERGYRHIFTNFPDVGGRYSALTYFGMVPAALMGVGVEELLIRAGRMERACGPTIVTKENPGAELGAILGSLARRGRDKVTLLMPPRLVAFGMWLEQLLAESTGKEGRGIIPVVDEALGPPEVYGNDRLFVAFHLDGEASRDRDEHLAAACVPPAIR